MADTQIPLGEYLFRRLSQLSISHIFGVPGDFNLNLLDHIDSVPSLTWVGTRNELNGAYAADGYARTSGRPGVLVTTFGVGELSAINGIGGSVAEYVPIIHISGMTARKAQQARLMIHHTLGEGREHTIFTEVSKPLSAATAVLMDNEAEWTAEIDRVIEVAFKRKLPVYLYIPIDVPDILVDASRLETPLDLEIRNAGKEEREDELVEFVTKRLKEAERPALLVDLIAQRYGLREEIEEIAKLAGVPAFATPLGKSVIDETSPYYGGLYLGFVTKGEGVKEAFESADFVFSVGHFPSDSNTGGWTQKFPEMVAGNGEYVRVQDANGQIVSEDKINFVPVVKKVLERLRKEANGNSARDPWWSWVCVFLSPSTFVNQWVASCHLCGVNPC
jgi:pyruvate decarboxylase